MFIKYVFVLKIFMRLTNIKWTIKILWKKIELWDNKINFVTTDFIGSYFSIWPSALNVHELLPHAILPNVNQLVIIITRSIYFFGGCS